MPVPEASVYENDFPAAREYHVGTAGKLAVMQAISEAKPMQHPP
jgi:hypothetical protein